MSNRIIVDPITRIEGHLRIEAQMDGSKIAKAYSAGTMVRGIETILKGRDPRDAWAFAQRICGVCTLVHGIAAVRSVEDALKYEIPKNANLIRNLMIGTQYIYDHVMHFYILHALDWVDVVSALSADTKATSKLAQSISNYSKSSPGYFLDMQKKIKKFVEDGQLGIFAKGYWGHPEYKLPAEANLMAVSHYLEALEWQREVAKLHTIFGGKNPHPNFLVGGVPSPIDLDSDSAINAKRLSQVKEIINKMQSFVDEVYVPDTLAIASFYKDWGSRGEGLGNFMTYGDFPVDGSNNPESYLIPKGIILNRDLSKIHDLDLNATDEVQEYISHSFYDYSKGKNTPLHPYDGETNLNYSGPKPPYNELDVENSYSWIKSPRWKGHAVEVGPLARVLMMYAKGHEQTKDLVNMALKNLDIPIQALFSTLGRTAARTLETKVIADNMHIWFDNLVANVKAGDTKTFNEKLWEPKTWPKTAKGVGFTEAPRGGLAHWIVIKDGKIDNYQAVVPTTWNGGPRDDKNKPGAYEAALEDNHNLHDPTQPIEILRTVHSFDPCISCAVHVLDENKKELINIKIT